MENVKILFFASNPRDQLLLELDEEVRAIQSRIRSSKYSCCLSLETRWATRPSDIIQALNETLPQIVHFSGHGESSGLVFHNDKGKSICLPRAALQQLFAAMKDNVRLVVLNACYTWRQASTISNVIDCVIGMKSTIKDQTAIRFAATFYSAIGFGRSIQSAFDQGLAAIALYEATPSKHLPTLVHRSEIDPKEIILMNGSKKTMPAISLTSEIDKLTNEDRIKTIQMLENIVNSNFDTMCYSDKSEGDSYLRSVLPDIIKRARSGNIHNISIKHSILMADIDQLTIINKIYGQNVGTNIIKIIAEIIKEESGAESSGRCGDDTFYAYFPGASISEVGTIAQHILYCIQNYSWSSLASDLKVTCSLGIAEIQHHEDVRDWIIRAAIGFKTTKKAGGNSVQVGPQYLSLRLSREFNDYYS